MTSTPFTVDESGDSPSTPGSQRSALDRLWQRDLDAYPDSGRRYGYLAIVVLTTIVLYYSLYTQYAVATSLITHFNITYTYFIWVSVIGNGLGAVAALVASRGDRWGRANMVVY